VSTEESHNRRVKLAPSILSADFARLGEQVSQLEKAGADRIHVDVMDGHFVPNISFGAAIVHSIRPITRLPLEIHLMISDPDFFLEQFVEAGGDSFLVHWEGNNNLYRTIRRIKELEKPVGVVINPATPALVLKEILREVNLVLVMTINPGFGGQRFLEMTVPKIRQMRQMIEQVNPYCELELDGGIDPITAPIGVAAGADVLVVGSAIFDHADGVAAGVKQLQLTINRAGTS
jgi:ribulose-phosphate 3-epimerase